MVSGLTFKSLTYFKHIKNTQLVKNPPAMRRPGFDPWVEKTPLEKGKATHSSILAWRIP